MIKKSETICLNLQSACREACCLPRRRIGTHFAIKIAESIKIKLLLVAQNSIIAAIFFCLAQTPN